MIHNKCFQRRHICTFNSIHWRTVSEEYEGWHSSHTVILGGFIIFVNINFVKRYIGKLVLNILPLWDNLLTGGAPDCKEELWRTPPCFSECVLVPQVLQPSFRSWTQPHPLLKLAISAPPPQNRKGRGYIWQAQTQFRREFTPT